MPKPPAKNQHPRQGSPETPLVSVIINCRNGEKYVRQTIESVYGQTLSSWEIVLWDDRSNDATPAIAKSFGDRLRYFRSDDDVPLGTNRHRAVTQARGKFVAFLDADDLWETTKLESQLERFRQDAGLGVVYTDAVLVDPRLRPLRLQSHSCRFHEGDVLESLFLFNFLVFSSVMVRREAVEKIGGFRGHLPVAAEDLDFVLRLAEHYAFGAVNRPLVRYRVHPTSWSSSSQMRTAANLAVLQDCVDRNPRLAASLGPRVLRYRLAGLNCDAAERYALQGNLSAARREARGRLGGALVLPRTGARFLLACLGPRSVFGFYRAWTKISPRRLLT